MCACRSGPQRRPRWRSPWRTRFTTGTHVRSQPGSRRDVLAPFGIAAVAKQYGVDAAALESLADDLASAGNSSLVLAGPSLPVEAHAAVALINTMLGVEGHAVDTAFSVDAPPVATPLEMAALTREIASGQVRRRHLLGCQSVVCRSGRRRVQRGPGRSTAQGPARAPRGRDRAPMRRGAARQPLAGELERLRAVHGPAQSPAAVDPAALRHAAG